MSSYPKMDAETNKSKCQSIYWNLLCCIEAGAPGEVFIHELVHTTRCDRFHNLTHVRDSVEKQLSPQTLKDVLNFSVDPVVVKKADIVVSHYAKWANNEIYDGLSYPNKAYYQTYFRWDKWASGVTIFAGSVGGLFKVYKRLAAKK